MNRFETMSLTFTLSLIVVIILSDETLSAPVVGVEPPYVPEPSGRGTVSLLSTCIITLTLCVWTKGGNDRPHCRLCNSELVIILTPCSVETQPHPSCRTKQYPPSSSYCHLPLSIPTILTKFSIAIPLQIPFKGASWQRKSFCWVSKLRGSSPLNCMGN